MADVLRLAQPPRGRAPDTPRNTEVHFRLEVYDLQEEVVLPVPAGDTVTLGVARRKASVKNLRLATEEERQLPEIRSGMDLMSDEARWSKTSYTAILGERSHSRPGRLAGRPVTPTTGASSYGWALARAGDDAAPA